MSQIRANSIVNSAGDGSPSFPFGIGDAGVNYAATAGIATNAQGLTGTPDISVRNVTGVAATFTDDVSVSDNTNSVKLKENGTATFISGTTAVLKIKDAANSGVNKITLKKDGSGEYHGDIQVGGDANNGAEAGVGIGSIGRIDVARAAASPIIRGYRTDSSARTVLITSSGNAEFTGDLTVGGDVSIGGSITYEDVSSVNSVGIITAQDGIDVTGRDINITSGGVNAAGVITATEYDGYLFLDNQLF